MVTIAVTAEPADEPRVAVSPETVKKLVGLGATVKVEAGAGARSRFSDETLRAQGAEIAPSAAEALRDADILLKVRRPSAADVAGLKPGALVIAMLDPYGDRAALQALAGSKASLFTMEFMPRITRAQSMDVLSSQANLAGYKAVVDAAAMFQQAMPMMMTPAGTVPAAKAFIMGVGVAGLQAIATARRLGAQVTATDVRPATKEQVASLGAKFVGLTAGLILLLLLTALISLRNSADTVRQIESVVNFAIPAYAALARGHIRSLEQALELRRSLLLAEDPATPDDTIAQHVTAFLAAREQVQVELAEARRLLEAERSGTKYATARSDLH